MNAALRWILGVVVACCLLLALAYGFMLWGMPSMGDLGGAP